MSKILITGNGFDLFHHLPTKYHHFISIMETIEGFGFKKEVTFVDLFGRIFKDKYLDDYNSIVDSYNVNQIKFDNSKIKQIDELLKTNLWYKHFKNVCEIDTWIDFEMEIENVLNQLAIFYNLKIKKAIDNYMFRKPLLIDIAFEIFGVLEFDKNLGAYVISENFINKRNLTFDIKKILEDLSSSFEDFIIIFNRFLVDIVNVFYDEIKQKESIPFHLMNEIYTFNYTPTFENIYNIDKSKIVYLHGKINEDYDKQNIVLGISDISSEIKASKMFDFTKYHQKIIKRSNEKFIEVPEYKKSSSGETVFYIIGHSLDESDKEYIIDLFKFLKYDNDKKSKICVFCYDKKDEINKLKNLLSIINKNVIVKLNKNERLYFVELNVANLNREFNNDNWSSSFMEPTVFS